MDVDEIRAREVAFRGSGACEVGDARGVRGEDVLILMDSVVPHWRGCA